MDTNVVKLKTENNFGHENAYRRHSIQINHVKLIGCWNLNIDGNIYKCWTLDEVVGKLNQEVMK